MSESLNISSSLRDEPFPKSFHTHRFVASSSEPHKEITSGTC